MSLRLRTLLISDLHLGSSSHADVLRGGMPTEDDLRAVPVLDDPLTRPHLARHGVWRPRIDTGLLAAYSAHFHAEGWLDRPPRPSSRSFLLRRRADDAVVGFIGFGGDRGCCRMRRSEHPVQVPPRHRSHAS